MALPAKSFAWQSIHRAADDLVRSASGWEVCQERARLRADGQPTELAPFEPGQGDELHRAADHASATDGWPVPTGAVAIEVGGEGPGTPAATQVADDELADEWPGDEAAKAAGWSVSDGPPANLHLADDDDLLAMDCHRNEAGEVVRADGQVVGRFGWPVGSDDEKIARAAYEGADACGQLEAVFGPKVRVRSFTTPPVRTDLAKATQ